MKRLMISLLIAAQLGALPATAIEVQMTKVPSANSQAMKKKIDDLINQMTLEEKIGQMNLVSIGFDVTGPVVSQDVDEKIKKGLVGGVFNTYTPQAVRKLQDIAVNQSRLKIPLLFGYDVIHGHRTIFPINLGLSCSWDPELVERTARAAAKEAAADGLNWVFSPMVDICRDPRWGRVSEGSGEDPYLGGEIAKATVRGYQGKNYDNADTVLACVKHYALYGAAEAGRDYNTVDMSPVRMYNEYLPPYKAAVDAGVATVMTSFNEINGIPATANKWLVKDILRKQWGFNGVIATDYTAVSEMIAHGMGDEKKVTELAINAGIDMDMVSELFIKYGADLAQTGKVSIAEIDAACRRVLEAKYKLGLFSDPYRYLNEEKTKSEMMSADKLQLSKEAAIKSMVLLKNANQLLPLDGRKKVAFIGPFIKDNRNLIGSWSGAGDWKTSRSIWQALEKNFPGNQFLYSRGCNILEDDQLIQKLNVDSAGIKKDEKPANQLLQEAVETAKQSDVIVAALGEPFIFSGEAASRSTIGLPENQMELLKALKATGKPIVLVLMNGRPLTLPWENEHLDAILETWFAGTMAGDAIIDTLFGQATPSGKLSITFPINVGQIPIYYNAKNTGRPTVPNEKYHSQYLDVTNKPLYPFGHGLSYTTFGYTEPVLSASKIGQSDKLTVSTKVTNTGSRPGVETVQLYIRDLVGTITRPLKELKRFRKIQLQPGETQTVTFELTVDDLKFYNSDLKLVAEPGDFEVSCGTDSSNVKTAKFSLE